MSGHNLVIENLEEEIEDTYVSWQGVKNVLVVKFLQIGRRHQSFVARRWIFKILGKYFKTLDGLWLSLAGVDVRLEFGQNLVISLWDSDLLDFYGFCESNFAGNGLIGVIMGYVVTEEKADFES